MKSSSPQVWAHFEEFIAGFVAARELHARAAAAGAFVECVCLGASIVDAMLRIGTLLQYQIDNKSRDILVELILQNESDKALSERDIYRRALAASVIDDAVFGQLQALYNDRNRVIHRYVISRITTAEVLSIAQGYESMIERISARIHEIETRQIKLGVGITVSGPKVQGKEGRKFVEEFATNKHTPALAKAIRGS